METNLSTKEFNIMYIKRISPFSLTSRLDLMKIAKDEFNLKLDYSDPLVDLLSLMDYLISSKIAYVAAWLFCILVLSLTGILFLLLNILLKIVH